MLNSVHTNGCPDFLIVGLPKCGTTSLYQALRSHPGIFMPAVKEPHFFGVDLTRDPQKFYLEADQYLGLFAEVKAGQRTGEASTNTIFSKSACDEIFERNPAAKIIVMLREPVDFLHACHAQYVRTGVEPEQDFESALSLEVPRLRGERLPEKINLREKIFYKTNLKMVPEQIRAYQQRFGTERTLVILLDEMFQDMQLVYDRVLDFIGVPRFSLEKRFEANVNARNRSELVRRTTDRYQYRLSQLRQRITKRPTGFLRLLARLNRKAVPRLPLDRQVRAHLSVEFAPVVEELSQVTGVDLSHWGRGG